MEYNKDYIGFVYEWTNLQNGKKYIGSHKGSTEDGYIGSGIHFSRAYNKNPKYFQRTILEYVTVNDKKFILEQEQKWLNSVNEISLNESYYNLSSTAGGGNNHSHILLEERHERIYKKWREGLDKRLEEMTEEEKTELANKKRLSWNKRDLVAYSKKKREDRLYEEANMSDADKENRRKRERKKISRIKKEQPEHWEQWQKNRSESISQWHQDMDDGKRQVKNSKTSQTKLAQKLKWINKNGERKMVPLDELNEWVNNGWSIGMN